MEHCDVTLSAISALESAHFRKIELSDAIYFVDIQGYIGDQVSKEITFAKGLGKEVIYHSIFQTEGYKF